MARQKNFVAASNRKLTTDQLAAVGGCPMPTDAQGRVLHGPDFERWLDVETNAWKQRQVDALDQQIAALEQSQKEAQRLARLFGAELERRRARVAELGG